MNIYKLTLVTDIMISIISAPHQLFKINLTTAIENI